MLYLISYDIPETARRTKVAKVLLDYGTRVQYSVFECALKEKAVFEKMCRRLDRLIKPDEDNLRIYSLCGTCREALIVKGIAQVLQDPDVYVL